MTIFVCGDEFDSILCGVYDAWMSGLGHEDVRLETRKEQQNQTMQMFVQYRETKEAPWKVKKTADAVKRKISQEAYAWIYRASLSREKGRADKIFRFLIKGFRFGSRAVKMLKDPDIYEVFFMNRQVANEAHLLTGFLRFSELPMGQLAAVMGPEHNVLGLVADHFAERMSGERWIIFDKKRGSAAIHEPGYGFILMSELPARWQDYLSGQKEEGEYEKLWRIFHSAVSIEERENRACQNSHLPLRFRSYMTEF